MKKQKFQSLLLLFLLTGIFAMNFSFVSNLYAEFPFFSKTGSVPPLPSLLKPKEPEPSGVNLLFNAGAPIVGLTISPNYKYLAVQTLQNLSKQPDPITGMRMNKNVNVWNIEYNLPFKEAESEFGPLTWIMGSAFGDKGRSFYIADYSKARTTMSGSVSGPINVRKIDLEEKKHFHSLLVDTGFQRIRLFKGNHWFACQAWNGTWRLISSADTGRIINFPDIDISKDPVLRLKNKAAAEKSKAEKKDKSKESSKDLSKNTEKNTEKKPEKVLSKEEIKKELREELLAELQGKRTTQEVLDQNPPTQTFPPPATENVPSPKFTQNSSPLNGLPNQSNSPDQTVSSAPELNSSGFSESSNFVHPSAAQDPNAMIGSDSFSNFNNAEQIQTTPSHKPSQIENHSIEKTASPNEPLKDAEISLTKAEKTVQDTSLESSVKIEKKPEIDPKNRRKVVDILAISESGNLVATLISDGGEAWEDYILPDSPPSIARTIVIWDLKVVSSINYQKLEIPLEAIEVARFVVEDGIEPRKCVFSKSETMIAVRSKSRYVGIWETASGKLLSELGEHKQNIRAIDFSPNNLKIVVGTGGERACLVLWDIRKETVHRIYEERNPDVKNITTVTFDPDSRIVYYGNDCGEVKSWFVGKKK